MTGQQLKNSILQEAIQGRLVPNVLQPGEKTGAELLQDILAERQKKENEEKGKNAKKLTLSIIEEEPYELPDGWCWCKLGDIADIERGGNFAKSDFVKNGYPCIHYGQIHMRFGARTYSVLSYLSDELAAKQRKAHPGDIIMAVTSENIEDVCKCTAWLGDYDVAIGAHTAIIRHYVDSVFLVYYFKSSLFYSQKKELGHGSKVIEVTPGTLNNVYFPLPPLSIQKAIVEKIEALLPLVDEYDKAAGELKTLNEILPDKLRKSVLQEAIKGNLVPNVLPEGEATAPELLQHILKERQEKENREKGKKAKKLTLSTIGDEPWELPNGWCWCRLGDVGEFTRGNGIKKDEVTPDGFPCIRYGELYTRYRIQFNSVVSHVNEATYNKSQKIESGDVVMALTGENEYDIALASVYLGDVPVAMGGDMTKLHPFIDSKYLVYFINSPYGIECKSLLATGQIIVHISNDKLASIQIPLPPLSIQHRIVEKIEEVFLAIDKLWSDRCNRS